MSSCVRPSGTPGTPPPVVYCSTQALIVFALATIVAVGATLAFLAPHVQSLNSLYQFGMTHKVAIGMAVATALLLIAGIYLSKGETSPAKTDDSAKNTSDPDSEEASTPRSRASSTDSVVEHRDGKKPLTEPPPAFDREPEPFKSGVVASRMPELPSFGIRANNRKEWISHNDYAAVLEANIPGLKTSQDVRTRLIELYGEPLLDFVNGGCADAEVKNLTLKLLLLKNEELETLDLSYGFSNGLGDFWDAVALRADAFKGKTGLGTIADRTRVICTASSTIKATIESWREGSPAPFGSWFRVHGIQSLTRIQRLIEGVDPSKLARYLAAVNAPSMETFWSLITLPPKVVAAMTPDILMKLKSHIQDFMIRNGKFNAALFSHLPAESQRYLVDDLTLLPADINAQARGLLT